MPLLTLISDYGLKDYHVATLKAEIMFKIPTASIIDISHNIQPYTILEAVYNWVGFQKKINRPAHHYIFVNAEAKEYSDFLILKKAEQYVFTADNGFAYLASFFTDIDAIYRVKIPENTTTLDFYIYLSQRLIAQEEIETFAEQIDLKDTKENIVRTPEVLDNGNKIKFSIIYEDEYGNAVTNLSKKMFDEVGKNRKFRFEKNRERITKIHKHYADFNVPESQLREKQGHLILLFNDIGFLQLSLYKSDKKVGTIGTLFALRNDDANFIIFENTTNE